MADISNKTLAALLVIGMAFSIVTLFSFGGITGRATEANGTAQVNITDVTAISLTDATVDFGQVGVNATSSSCTVSSETGGYASTDCASVSGGETQGFLLQNDGNTNVSVTLNSTNAESWISGTSPAYKYKSVDSEASSCSSGLVGSYTEIDNTAQTVCTNLLYDDGNDLIEIPLQITVPSDADIGVTSNSVVFTATAS